MSTQSMPRRAWTVFLALAAIAVALLLCIDIVYFALGSMEFYPTPEQHDKVRTIALLLAIPLVLIEAALLLLLRHRGSRRIATR